MKEDLIIAVQSRPALWDKRHKNHHNRHLLDREWKAVATELKSTDKEVKLVWKNLRDEFRKQFNKTPRSGDAAPEPTSSWKFFNALLFLRDQFEPRRSTGNLTVSPDDANVDNNEDVEPLDNLVEEQVDSPSVINEADASLDPDLTELNIPSTSTNESRSNNSSPAPTLTSAKRTTEENTRTGYKKRLTTQAQIGQELVKLEKEKLKLKMNKTDEINKNDEDVGFFNSLLPHVKTLDPRKKMMFRMKVQQVLFDLTYSPEQELAFRNRPPSEMSDQEPANRNRPPSEMSHRYDNHLYYTRTETNPFARPPSTRTSASTPSLTSENEEEYMPNIYTHLTQI